MIPKLGDILLTTWGRRLNSIRRNDREKNRVLSEKRTSQNMKRDGGNKVAEDVHVRREGSVPSHWYEEKLEA